MRYKAWAPAKVYHCMNRHHVIRQNHSVRIPKRCLPASHCGQQCH
ncbi:MAG TPA: hypothetical protein DEO96_10960 [Alteromonas sp.]|nr:hypothetical protein [Alteromonas sp.]